MADKKTHLDGITTYQKKNNFTYFDDNFNLIVKPYKKCTVILRAGNYMGHYFTDPKIREGLVVYATPTYWNFKRAGREGHDDRKYSCNKIYRFNGKLTMPKKFRFRESADNPWFIGAYTDEKDIDFVYFNTTEDCINFANSMPETEDEKDSKKYGRLVRWSGFLE